MTSLWAQVDPGALSVFGAFFKDFGPWTVSALLFWLYYQERTDRKAAEKEGKDLAKQIVSDDTKKVLESAAAIAAAARDLGVRRSNG